MASLLNMLNNFLGSAENPSLFNLNSTNISQGTDFRSIVDNLLNSAEGDAQNLAESMPDQNGGVDLPLLDAAGNALPPQLATAMLDVNTSIQLPDAEPATSVSSANGGELLTLHTAGEDAKAETQAMLNGTLELATLPGIEASMSVSAALAAPLGGIDQKVDGEPNLALQHALTAALVPQNGDPVSGTVDASIDTKQSANSSVAEPITLLTQAQAQAQAQAQVLAPSEVPAGATPALGTDGKPQLAVGNDLGAAASAPASSSAATPATSTAATPAAQGVTQNTAQLAAQPAAVDAAALAAKDPQQFAREQALGSEAGSDNDEPAEGVRQTLMPPSPTLRAAPATTAALPVTDPNFANVANMLTQGQALNGLNERLQLMLSNGQHSAEIQLDPPELGSLQVKVTTRNEQTQVIFVAPNNAVRDALEQQLPRLRETLENAGLQLQDASVFAQTDDKSGSQPQSYADVEAADDTILDELDESVSSPLRQRVATQLVDAYI